MDILSSVTGAITLTKQLLNFATAAKDAESKLILADLQLKLAELKGQLAELINENIHLKDELKKASSTSVDVVLKDGAYFKNDGDGPFCTICYDKSKQMIRVSAVQGMLRKFGKWRCGSCKNQFGD